MNSEYLLREVRELKQVQITQKLVESIQDFKNAIEVNSMENLALVLSGHQPMKNYQFDITKFENWCKENHLIFYFLPLLF